MKLFIGGRMNGKSQYSAICNEAIIRVIGLAEKAEEIREYCEKSVTHCDELVEKYQKNTPFVTVAGKNKVIGMGDAYADILERFFKETDHEQ